MSRPGHSATPSGAPAYGDTLRLVGTTGVDHFDTASAAFSHSRQVQRTFARQLFSYPAADDWRTATAVVADVAAEIPTRANGGLSDDGLTYTIRLRPGVLWDSRPPRPVTAADFVRGLKRLASPLSGCGAIGYYTSTITGMREYCESYARAFDGQAPTAAQLARFQDEHEIEGVCAKDDETLVIRLLAPAGDFLNILALGYASAAPAEYDRYLPDDAQFRRNIVSNGPYRVARIVQDQELVLERNPAWSKSADPIRNQYADRIHIRQNVNDARAAQLMIESSEADLAYAVPVPSEEYARLRDDPRFRIYPGFILNPYIVFNFANDVGPAADLLVRQAVNFAIDKVKINDVYGTPETNNPLHGVIPPGNLGHRPFNLYPTPGDRGSPATARSLLTAAGYRDDLVLRLAYRDSGFSPELARCVAADLAACGVRTELLGIGNEDFYGSYITDPANARAGAWDLALAGYIPDWYGNNGRAIVQPLFQSNGRPGTTNYGCYHNPEVDDLIAQALAEYDPDRAADLWHQADRTIMADAAVVPTQSHGTPRYYGRRVRGARFIPFLESFDLTNIWLDQGPSS